MDGTIGSERREKKSDYIGKGGETSMIVEDLVGHATIE